MQNPQSELVELFQQHHQMSQNLNAVYAQIEELTVRKEALRNGLTNLSQEISNRQKSQPEGKGEPNPFAAANQEESTK